MHEFSVMSDVLEALKEESLKHDFKGVKQVVLEVGELTFLAHEQLRFSYGVLSKGTVFEGSELSIENRPAMVRCDSCGFEGEGGFRDEPEFHRITPTFSCPKCEEPTSVVSGNECIIRRIVADVEE
jgi:hydrogenase nickel incorporation protein HypA/HybF